MLLCTCVPFSTSRVPTVSIRLFSTLASGRASLVVLATLTKDAPFRRNILVGTRPLRRQCLNTGKVERGRDTHATNRRYLEPRPGRAPSADLRVAGASVPAHGPRSQTGSCREVRLAIIRGAALLPDPLRFPETSKEDRDVREEQRHHIPIVIVPEEKVLQRALCYATEELVENQAPSVSADP